MSAYGEPTDADCVVYLDDVKSIYTEAHVYALDAALTRRHRITCGCVSRTEWGAVDLMTSLPSSTGAETLASMLFLVRYCEGV